MIESFRAWCDRSALFNSVWGFGLGLVLVSLVIRLVHFDNVCQLQDFVLCSWRLGSTSLGMFAAGSGAYLFIKSRRDGKLVKTILVAGVTFVSVFPLSAVALIAWMEIDHFVRRNSPFSAVRNFFGELNGFWWGNLWAYGIWYPLGIVICSAAYVWMPQAHTDANRRAANVPVLAAMPRRRDLAVGTLLIVFGITVAYFSREYFLSQMQLTIAQAKQWNRPELLQRVAELRNHLWGAVGLFSLPYGIVGVLLLVPFGRRHPRP